MAAAAPPRPAFRIEIAEADVGDLTARPKCSPWRLPYTFSPELIEVDINSRSVAYLTINESIPGEPAVAEADSFCVVTVATLIGSIPPTMNRARRIRLSSRGHS